MRHHSSRRRAFSLLEILVVLGIASLIGALVLGGFSSFQGSQRRSTCQSNMVQIYRAARLYANDNDAFPPTYTVAGQTQLSGGLGLLWAQIDLDASGNPQNTGLKAPGEISSYLKSSRPLHCPADGGIDSITNQPVPQTAINDQGQVNLGYLSYQKADTKGGDDANTNVNALDKNQSYTVRRTQASSDIDFARQLRHLDASNRLVDIPTPSNTIITWCPFHRGASKKADTVLFFDGSVRRLEESQDGTCLAGHGTTPLAGWRRVAQCSTDSAGMKPDNEGARLAQP